MTGRVEDFDVEIPQDTSTTEPARAWLAGSSGRRAGAVPWVALALALVVLGVLAAPVPGMRDRGLVPALSDAPQPQWSVALHSVRAAQGQVWIADQRVLAASGNALRAADLATGAIAWEMRGNRLRCSVQAPAIACVSGLQEQAELIELSTHAGELERTDMPHLLFAVPHERGLIGLWKSGDVVTVTRADLTGRQVWEEHLSPYSGPIEWSEVRMAVVDDAVLLSLARDAQVDLGIAALDVDDGAARRSMQALSEHDGEWLVNAENTLVVYGLSGQPWPVGSAHLQMPVDDDPGGELVFDLTETSVQARALSTNELLWEFVPGEPAPVVPQARLDGVLVVWSEGQLRGLHLADGTARWQQPAGAPMCPCYADGRVLTHLTWRDGTHLRGIDVTNGQTAWEVPVGSDRSFAYGTDGTHLAVATDSMLSLWQLG